MDASAVGELITTLGIGIAAFVSTDLDDLVVLIGFFSDPYYRVAHVVLGQFLGISLLVAASLLLSLTALVIPVAYIGFMGLLPFGIGLKRLLDGSEELGPGTS